MGHNSLPCLATMFGWLSLSMRLGCLRVGLTLLHGVVGESNARETGKVTHEACHIPRKENKLQQNGLTIKGTENEKKNGPWKSRSHRWSLIEKWPLMVAFSISLIHNWKNNEIDNEHHNGVNNGNFERPYCLLGSYSCLASCSVTDCLMNWTTKTVLSNVPDLPHTCKTCPLKTSSR